MIARVLTVDVEPERVEAIVSRYRELVRPIHAQAGGLRKHYVMVDRERGRIMIVGVWGSQEALQEVASVLEPARETLWAEFGQTPALESYEVADEI